MFHCNFTVQLFNSGYKRCITKLYFKQFFKFLLIRTIEKEVSNENKGRRNFTKTHY